MIKTLLIANRGEIACRVIRTAQRMGIRTVAVYSDADARAKHVRMADEAVHIGPSAAVQSYLRAEVIIDAARRSDADAIHPGYGFLSENAQFAEQCEQADLCFVGPPADAIRAMGSKRAALQLMAEHDVPVLPGYHGQAQDDQALIDASLQVGFPLIIKPSAGGGGKGMQIADDIDQLRELLPATRRVAKAAFGDDTLLLERYLNSARHIEIQVFADNHGNCVHLHERDCSLQRRHQKVVEEAPAPGLSSRLREAMAQVAIRATQAIDYRGAGTIEFLYDASHDGNPGDDPTDNNGGFYFMEMNTRLQVEHPVTEMITGVDLVQWQLMVAAGEALPLQQEQILVNGHAIEARIYAEDPQRDFLPATGTVQWLQIASSNGQSEDPDQIGDHMQGARVDAGVDAGDSVSPYYDPMIAKLIVHGDTRSQALSRLKSALAASDLGPLANNIGFLRDLATNEQWLGGAVDTGFLQRAADQLGRKSLDSIDAALAVNAWLVTTAPNSATDPWSTLRGMRLNLAPCEHSRLQVATLLINGFIERHDDHYTVRLTADANSNHDPSQHGTDESNTATDCKLYALHGLRRESDKVLFERDGRRQQFRIHLADNELHVDDGNARATVTLLDNATPSQAGQSHGAGKLVSPMPGRVVSVSVAPGDRVEARQALAVLEAMKMEHALVAPGRGIVTEVNCAVDDQVEEGVALIAIELD